jgi:hypothetical protein
MATATEPKPSEKPVKLDQHYKPIAIAALSAALKATQKPTRRS